MTNRDSQLELQELGVGGSRPLISQHFLTARLPKWPEFTACDPQKLFAELKELWHAEGDALQNANEAQTEERFIKPVLRALGFSYTVQESVSFAGGRYRMLGGVWSLLWTN